MENATDYQGIAKWKVGHPNTSNNITQMKSYGNQAPFFFGGSSTPYYLHLKGNSNTQPLAPKRVISYSK